MLTTDQAHALPSFPFLVNMGVTAWRAVSFDLTMRYIFVNCSFKEGRIWLSQASILWREEDVLGLCQDIEKDKSRRLLEVSLLLPTRNGRNTSWLWMPIQEIWARQIQGTEQATAVYVSFDGEKIGDVGNLPLHESCKKMFSARLKAASHSN